MEQNEESASIKLPYDYQRLKGKAEKREMCAREQARKHRQRASKALQAAVKGAFGGLVFAFRYDKCL